MATITQRFIDTLNFHKEHPGAPDIDEAGKAHVVIDQAHAATILSVVEDHQSGKTTDEEFKQALLDLLAHEDFEPHETMAKTQIKNILRHDFGVEVEENAPSAPNPTM
jgi:tryptophanyl-tRNA synthetase